jgi:hypothetical protein
MLSQRLAHDRRAVAKQISLDARKKQPINSGHFDTEFRTMDVVQKALFKLASAILIVVFTLFRLR